MMLICTKFIAYISTSKTYQQNNGKNATSAARIFACPARIESLHPDWDGGHTRTRDWRTTLASKA